MNTRTTRRCPLCRSSELRPSEMWWVCQKCRWAGSTPDTAEEPLPAAFRLGASLGRYKAVRWTVVGLGVVFGWSVVALRWSIIAAMVIGGMILLVVIFQKLNYAPLWSRSYSACVEGLPDASSITQAIRGRSACSRRASEIANEQMRLDELRQKFKVK